MIENIFSIFVKCLNGNGIHITKILHIAIIISLNIFSYEKEKHFNYHINIYNW